MAKNLLQKYFPTIRTQMEVEEQILENSELNKLFQSWKPRQQKEFLAFCTGERGVKILYDAFFKEVFNPEYAPERLEELLSLIMKQKVKILQVLPNDTTRIADETSLLVTDIVVELADHSIANVEIQKVGYMFPGQRSACYSADLLLRQYKRIRSSKENFSYRDIQNAYTIIFFEKSTAEFHQYPEHYFHCFEQKSDTGLELNLLQKYYFVPLDIFRKNIHNKNIKDDLEAWLTFLTCDEPEWIVELITVYPQFKAMYEDVYELCRNIEGVMDMFSKELQKLDQNTTKYMIDEMQKQIDEKDNQLIQQAREKQLYTLLSEEKRWEELARALKDDDYRKQLLEKYQVE